MPRIKWKIETPLIFSRSLITGLLLIFITLIFIIGCSQQPSEEYKRNHPSAKQAHVFWMFLAPGNKTLLFNYQTPYWSRIGTYDMKTGKIEKFKNDDITFIEMAQYSHDGKKIVFSGRMKRFDDAENFYIMNADGRERKQITNDKNAKSLPSFSPDGKRIIYMRSHLKRARAFPLTGDRNDAWDIYELDIASGKETRLTHYNFYETTQPSYMPDGKRFIFCGRGPVNSIGKGPKNFEEYEKLYQKNFIFIMDGINNDLKPAFTFGTNSAGPSVSKDDSILFTSRKNTNDSSKIIQELYLYKNGKIKQLTSMKSHIISGDISWDGSTIIFIMSDGKQRSYWMMKSDGSDLKEMEKFSWKNEGQLSLNSSLQ